MQGGAFATKRRLHSSEAGRTRRVEASGPTGFACVGSQAIDSRPCGVSTRYRVSPQNYSASGSGSGSGSGWNDGSSRRLTAWIAFVSSLPSRRHL